MDLHYKLHPSNMELYIAPLANHESYDYANALLQHFHKHTLGLCSKKELEEFKLFVTLHGHFMILHY